MKCWRWGVRTLSPCVVASALVLGGCMTAPKKPVIDPIEVRLAESAAAIADSWQYTRQVVTAAHAPEAAPVSAAPAHWPAGLDKTIDMRWMGPLMPAVRALASVAGWTAQQLGQPIGADLIVDLHGASEPVGAFVRSAGIQAGQRADVLVAPGKKRITVIYRESNDRLGQSYE